MVKKLSTFEKYRREENHRREIESNKSKKKNEKNNNEREKSERQRANRERIAREKEARAIIKEREKQKTTAAKERGIATKKATKEAVEKERIAEIEKQVNLFQEFTERITGLHRKFKPNPKFFEFLSDGKLPNGRFLDKNKKPEIKIFVPKDLDEKSRMMGIQAKFTFNEYCRIVAKIKNDFERGIKQLETESSYTIEKFKELYFPKFTLSRLLTSKQEYSNFLLMKGRQLRDVKANFAKMKAEHEQFKSNKNQEYLIALEKHKQNEEIRLKEINAENETIEKEWISYLSLMDESKKIRTSWVEKLVAGDTEAIYQFLSILFPLKFDLLENEHGYIESEPRNIDIAYRIDENRKMSLLIELEPDSEFYLDKGVKLSPSGKNLIEFKIKDVEKRAKHSTIICSLALSYANFVFSYIEMIDELVLEIVEPKPNAATGNYENVAVLQFEVNRSAFSILNLDKIDPVKSIEHLGGKLIFSKKCSNLPTILEEADLQWLGSSSSGIEIKNMDQLIELNSILKV